MTATNPIAPYVKLDSTSMSGTVYKTSIDGNSVAALRIAGRFAPSAQTSPNMTVLIAAGNLFDGVNLTEYGATSTGTFTAPVSHPRIDRIVLDNVSGAITIVTGTEAVSPVAPAIPSGKSPIAQVALTTSTTAITNSIISDERNFGALTVGGFGVQTTLASASTCDLGTITSRNVKITGMTAITSFGTSANTTSPIYLIEFAAALTLNYNATSMILPGGTNITTAAGDTAIIEYLGSGNWKVRQYTAATPQIAVIRNFIDGYQKVTTSYSASITVGAGQASDSTNAAYITMPSSMVKTTSNWAAGTNNGGLDTGSISAYTWYTFYAIMRTDTGAVDIVFSTSATGPTLPSPYTLYRRIGAAQTDGSGYWLQMVQDGDEVQFLASVLEYGSQPGSNSAFTQNLTSCPPGVKVLARLQVHIKDFTSSGGAQNALLVTSLDMNDETPSGQTNPQGLSDVSDVTSSASISAEMTAVKAVMTNTSGQIRVRMQAANPAGPTIYIRCYGYVDKRGKQ